MSRTGFNLLWLLGLGLCLAGCRPQPLEQAGVDLQWGFRLDEAGQEASIPSNLEQNGFLHTQSVLVELAFASKRDSDSTLLPHFPGVRLAQLSNRPEIQLSIALTTTNVQEVFPDFRLPAPEPWFRELERLTDSLLSTFEVPPARLILGNDLRPTEQLSQSWNNLFQRLKAKHPQTAFGYGKMLDEVPQIDWWEACDFIAVEYPPLADPNPRPFCLEHTPPAAQLSDSLKLPVFIYRANIMGKFKVIQMKNRLRFWQPIQLSGLALNSLYNRIPLLDSTSYFAIGIDEKLKVYLKEYAAGNVSGG